MVKSSASWYFLVVTITASLILCVQFFQRKSVVAQSSHIPSFEQSTIMATASAPPKLVPAFFKGKPVFVLYVTQPEDTILVRCYPTYEPTLELRAMGSNSDLNTQKEGVIICRPSQ